MEINSIDSGSSQHQLNNIIKCGICHAEIENSATIYQDGLHFGVVCEKCYKTNSREDLELMANMFLAYGGYFGMIKDSNYSLYKTLKRVVSQISTKEKDISVEKLNIKLMHQVLLHGITPHQFIQGLKILLE
ncbi:MAG: hypothetical protein ACFE9Q_11255 [Candidatus Hodarchaeota archaeon]